MIEKVQLIMERFLGLQYDPTQKIPPIDQLLGNLPKEKRNSAYFSIAEQLRRRKLNPTYALVSLRKMIEMCFLSMAEPTEEDLKPENSYKWLYLIHTLASRQLSDVPELEKQKIMFVFDAYMKFIKKADIKKPFVVPCVTGIICAACRLIDTEIEIPDLVVDESVYECMMSLMNVSDLTSDSVVMSDFEVDELFLFASPLSTEYLMKSNLFGKPEIMLKGAILRLLNRITEKRLPGDLDGMKNAVKPFCMKGTLSDLAIKVLIKLFGGDEAATYKFTDSWQYDKCLTVITEMYQTSNHFKNVLGYEQMVKLGENLAYILNLAREHPVYWGVFTVERQCASVLSALLQSEYDIDLVIAAAKLVKIAELKLENVRNLLNIFITSQSKSLSQIIGDILICHPNEITKYIADVLPLVCHCGSRSQTFFDFLEKIIPLVDDKKSVLGALTASLKKEYENISLLENSHIYEQLSRYIDVTGAYLDSQPCTVCNNPELVPEDVNCENYTSFSKYEHDSVYLKLKDPMTVESFSLDMSRGRSWRSPRTVSIYVSGAEITSRTDLIGEKANWRHIADLDVPKGSQHASVTLPLRTKVTSVRFHYTDVWEDANNSREYKCPSCGNEVPDRRSGTCPRCGDNCYQCRNCRHINYGNLDPLICVECGNCSMGNLNWSIKGTKSFSHTHITTDDELDTALNKCDQLLASAHSSYQELNDLRSDIEKTLSPASTAGLSSKAGELNRLYNNECKKKFEGLTRCVQHVYAIRSSVAVFKNRANRGGHQESENMCYNCMSTYIQNCLKFFVSVVNVPEAVDSDLDIPTLLFSFASENTRFTTEAVSSLISFCSGRWELTLKIVESFTNSLPNVSPQVIRLICELEKIEDKRAERLQLLVGAIGEAVKHMNVSSFTPTVLQPLMSAVCKSPLLLRSADKYSLVSIWNAWAKKKCSLLDPYDTILCKNFAMDLLFKCSSKSIRSDISQLFITAANNGHFTEVSSMICEYIRNSSKYTVFDEQGYDVFCSLLAKNHQFMIHTLFNGLFHHIVKLFDTSVEDVIANEENISLNLSIGREPYTLMQIVKLYLSDNGCLRYVIEQEETMICQVITVYFKIRSLVIQRSKYLDDTLSSLKEIIMRVMQRDFSLIDLPEQEQEIEQRPSQIHEHMDEDDEDVDDDDYDDGIDIDELDDYERLQYLEERAFRREMRREERRQERRQQMSARASPVKRVLPKRTNSSVVINNNGPKIMLAAAVEAVRVCPDIIIREISSIIFPVPVAMKVPIITKKASTQEDFIPGRLPREPVLSDNFGKIMKDIKNKVCTDLGMLGLINDDHGMELLVDGNIISLDLPIEDVYKNVWSVKHSDSPMIVICRLQGFDGEAREPMISSFPAAATQELPPEIKYEYTTVLCDSGFKQLLAVFEHESISEKALEELIHLMEAFCHVRKNRKSIIANNGVSWMFRLMKRVISTATPEVFARVIAVTNRLIQDSQQFDDIDDTVSFIFEALKTPLLRNNEKTVLGPFLSLIGPLAEHKHEVMQTVVKFFAEALAVPEGNMFTEVRSYFILNGFSELLLSLAPNDAARDLILKEPIVHDAIKYLCEKFPLSAGKDSAIWQNSAEIRCIPMILKILTGMALNHAPTHEMFLRDDSHLIRILLQLSCISSKASIGEYAGDVLKSSMQEPSLCLSVINEIKQAQDNAARERAEAEKAKVLQAATGVPEAFLSMYNELDAETWACCICKEGYSYLPEEPLGVYVYANRMGKFCNTATYFTCVHPSCHSKSRNRDQEEWEAAMVRNAEHPCNSIFPLPWETLSEDAYRGALTRYLDEFKRDMSYAHMLIMDLETHITKISRGEVIATEVGGGSLTSIVQLWPFLIYAGHVFMAQDPSLKETIERELEQLLDEGKNLYHALILSLWVLTSEEWDHIKTDILQLLVKAHKNKDGEDLIDIVKQPLLFYTIVNKIQELIKYSTGCEPVLKENGHLKLNNGNNAAWQESFKGDLLADGPQISSDFASLASEIRDTIMKCTDLTEALEYAGVETDADEWITTVLVE